MFLSISSSMWVGLLASVCLAIVGVSRRLEVSANAMAAYNPSSPAKYAANKLASTGAAHKLASTGWRRGHFQGMNMLASDVTSDVASYADLLRVRQEAIESRRRADKLNKQAIKAEQAETSKGDRKIAADDVKSPKKNTGAPRSSLASQLQVQTLSKTPGAADSNVKTQTFQTEKVEEQTRTTTAAAKSPTATVPADSAVDLGVLAGTLIGLGAAAIVSRSSAMSSAGERKAKQAAEAALTKQVNAEDAGKEKKDNMLRQIKNYGIAGVLSYALWEGVFWTIGGALGLAAYYLASGHWPDFSNPEDAGKVGAEAFAFVNLARFAVPLRIGLAISTAPWVDQNIVKRFGLGNKNLQPNEQSFQGELARRSDEVRARVQAARIGGVKNSPTILFQGIQNLIKDPLGWYSGREPSALYSNLPSSEEIAREDFLLVVATLNASMPNILTGDTSALKPILAKDFRIIGKAGERMDGLGQLRRLGEKLASQNEVQVEFALQEKRAGSATLPEFLSAHWSINFGVTKLPYWEIGWDRDLESWRYIPVKMEADAAFHINKQKQVDYVQIENWAINGQQFDVWPEEAINALQADISEIVRREPNWQHFATDFTVYDQTGISGNWIIPYDANKALLQVLRNFHSRLSSAFQTDFQAELERTFVVCSNGALEPALMSHWSYEINNKVDTPFFEGLTELISSLPMIGGFPAKMRGSFIFRFNTEGKISSMKVGTVILNGNELS